MDSTEIYSILERIVIECENLPVTGTESYEDGFKDGCHCFMDTLYKELIKEKK